jgi:hypothetical protein
MTWENSFKPLNHGKNALLVSISTLVSKALDYMLHNLGMTLGEFIMHLLT